MEKRKRWQGIVIGAVLLLTLYNILPTVFYYSKSLRQPIDQDRAAVIAEEIVSRVDQLEPEAESWLYSFARLLHVKPTSVQTSREFPGVIEVAFATAKEAQIFSRFLPGAGDLIPFVPAQLSLGGASWDDKASNKIVHVLRNVSVRLDPAQTNLLFQFSSRFNEQGDIAELYREVIDDRVVQLASVIGGNSQTGNLLLAVTEHPNDEKTMEAVLQLATDVVEIEKSFGPSSSIAERFYRSFAQVQTARQEELIDRFLVLLDRNRNQLAIEKKQLEVDLTRTKEAGELVEASKEQKNVQLTREMRNLEQAKKIIQQHRESFDAALLPLSEQEIREQLARSAEEMDPKDLRQILSFEGRNPLVRELGIEWDTAEIQIRLYDDVQAISTSEGRSENIAYQKEKLNQFLVNDLARVSRLTDETILPADGGYVVGMDHLADTKSILVLQLGAIASERAKQLSEHLQQNWEPVHPDLVREEFPILSYAAFAQLPEQAKKLGLVIYAPVQASQASPQGFRTQSIYVIARGLGNIVQKYQDLQNDEMAQEFMRDFSKLQALLQEQGFIGYPGSAFGISSAFESDYIFELNDYYSQVLKATREDFSVKGGKRYAVLDMSDVEQRILTSNRIADRTQEDLLKWRDAYASAQVDLDVTKRYSVPKPTKNVYIQNLLLSAKKYFTGDERKILKWGLDLSGGKTVRIGLRDKSNRPVTNPDDLRQVVNELYTRVNQLGVAERTIRIENQNILLEFPGSQALSAADLVKASTMYFHVVNEQFGRFNPNLAGVVNRFLQEVWNEAVVTNRKDIENINLIAWNHLGGGQDLEGENRLPMSEAAQTLYEHGLRLGNPHDAEISSAFNDQISAIAMYRGNEYVAWDSPAHPLVVIFNNYALEGSNLENIQPGYDPKEGNILQFRVKKTSDTTADGERVNPREDLYAWTSQFAEERIAGTQKEAFSGGKGWRMAVILNGSVITSPQLSAALRDEARIMGRFSQREINQLAADLKAGSLSFTPKILSEENVSPDLGKEERARGVFASLVAIALVVLAMVGYYRFAGLVASCAVLLNIFIMWGVLQNLGAALTLPGIAGIVLTIGMAVDANVLVFERIREEFAISGRIVSAIQAGYRKAFSAIVDSNITTIIAAFVLIQFDSGPIKGFAVTLIIGILSSMFTALFMTRYFFAGWVRNPKNKQLTMASWIGRTHIDFLKHAKTAFVLSGIVILVGMYFLVAQRNTMLGMDFTGGYSLTTVVEEKPGDVNYRVEAMDALLSAGASRNDFEVRQLTKPNQLRIQLGMSIEEKGHPFYEMPERRSEGKSAYEYQKNPRVTWVVDALQAGGLEVQKSELASIDNDWTVMSGQFSDTMRNNAIIGLLVALGCILVYITFRFEFKYAISSVIGLAHDVLITLSVLALFHFAGFPVQIDLQVVGALMTIIGYSLNDTIIIFDRIREDVQIQKRMSFAEIINHALNVTLGRTIMTSATTLLVLLALVLLGGPSIFAFSLVMTLGVVFGTLSSLFVVSPVMLYFHQKERSKQEEIVAKKVSP